MKNEIWKPINGYEKSYLISSHGNVKSLDRIGSDGRRLRGVLLAKRPNARGYTRCSLCDGSVADILVHRLVAEHFIKKIKGKNDINHKDGNQSNNNVNNLEWCTHNENMKHYFKQDKHYLTKNCTKVIDTLTGKEYGSIRRAALKTGISRGSIIYNLKKNKRWEIIK